MCGLHSYLAILNQHFVKPPFNAVTALEFFATCLN